MYYVTLAGPTLFVAVAVILGIITPGYRPIHNTISELALGKFGKIQKINFLICGLLILGIPFFFLTGDRFLTQRVCIGIMGAVILLSGVFKTDPIEGSHSTVSGTVHNFLFLFGIPAVVYAELDVLRVVGFDAIGTISLACATVSIPSFIWVVFGRTHRGLIQRILVCVTMLWITVISMRI